MNPYSSYVLPRLIDLVTQGKAQGEERAKLVPLTSGVVLELGSGRRLFAEHGRAPDPPVRRWQWRLNPTWRRLAGGCNLDRPIDILISEAGFQFTRLERGYGAGPRPFACLYRSIAELTAR